jgi:hypothetical protein
LSLLAAVFLRLLARSSEIKPESWPDSMFVGFDAPISAPKYRNGKAQGRSLGDRSAIQINSQSS